MSVPCADGLARVCGERDRFAPVVILGSPGAGKTQHLVRKLVAELEAGVPAEAVAFVTFSRAATAAALARARGALDLGPNDTPWFRTIHSAALHLLDHSPRRLVTEREWAEFARLHSYEFSDVQPEEDRDVPRILPTRSKDDLLRFAYDWGRSSRLPVTETIPRFPAAGPSPSAFRTYVRRFEAFKAEWGLRDFVDLLEDAFECDARPPVRVAFVDEAQDLSPLQIALVEKWFTRCERIYVAGDDDQAVYVHCGASPSWLRGLAARCPLERLTVSWRLPRAILEYSTRIIARNRDRVPKEVVPHKAGGEVRFLDHGKAIELLDGSQSTFVLARNRSFLRPIARALVERIVPFVVEGKGGPSPLSDPKLVRGVRSACRLHTESAGRILPRDLEAILAFVPRDTPLHPKGIGGRLRPFQKSERAFTSEEIEREFGLGALLDLIVAEGPLAPFQKLARWKHAYLQGLLERYGTLPEVRIVLTSMHASKGKEADLVIVLPDMSRMTFREYQSGGERGRESENRVFYVAVTRAQKVIVVVAPRSRRHFEFPSPPNSLASHVRQRWEERAAIQEYDAGLDRDAAEAAAARGAGHA